MKYFGFLFCVFAFAFSSPFFYTSCKIVLDPFSGAEGFTYPLVDNYSESFADAEKMQIIQEFAPIIYQNTRSDKSFGHQFYRTGDYMIKINFDHNWSTVDNWHHCIAGDHPKNSFNFDFTGACYASFVATETHYYLGYHIYHAMDDAVLEIDRHPNDLENVFIAVNIKTKNIDAMITNKHGWHMRYSNDFYAKDGKLLMEKDSKGESRPTVYISSNGDGVDGGHGIESWKGFRRHFVVRDLLKYDPSLIIEVPSENRPDFKELWGETGYQIILMEDPIEGFWHYRLADRYSPDNPFYRGSGFYGGGGAPWGFAYGHGIFNPIYMFECAFRNFSEVASKEYTSNLYLKDHQDSPEGTFDQYINR